MYQCYQPTVGTCDGKAPETTSILMKTNSYSSQTLLVNYKSLVERRTLGYGDKSMKHRKPLFTPLEPNGEGLNASCPMMVPKLFHSPLKTEISPKAGRNSPKEHFYALTSLSGEVTKPFFQSK